MVDKSGEINWFDGTARSVTPARGVPSVPLPVKPDNRRRHTRFQVASTQVVLHRDGFLSQGGARILVTEKLNEGQKVRLKITLEKYKDEIEIGGKVMWCFPSTNRKDFYVGIKFSTEDALTARKMAAVQEWFTSPQYQALRSKR